MPTQKESGWPDVDMLNGGRKENYRPQQHLWRGEEKGTRPLKRKKALKGVDIAEQGILTTKRAGEKNFRSVTNSHQKKGSAKCKRTEKGGGVLWRC